jgi:hypothetical protein
LSPLATIELRHDAPNESFYILVDGRPVARFTDLEIAFQFGKELKAKAKAREAKP